MKHATGFLSPEDYEKLKQLAKDADKSLVRYVTRLLERHVKEQWSQREEEVRPKNESQRN